METLQLRGLEPEPKAGPRHGENDDVRYPPTAMPRDFIFR
jgi:hypothetical protein